MFAAGVAVEIHRRPLDRLASVVAGMIFVLYLVYAELIGVGRICPYCTSVHIITFLLFTLIVCQFVFQPSATRATRNPG